QIGATDYTVNANETSATQDPSLSVEGTTVFIHSGVFDKKQTVDVPSSLLSTEPTQFNISTSDGTMNWTANYTAQAALTSTTVEVGDKSHVWPDDFSGSGTLPLPSDDLPAQVNISSLTTGEQSISIHTEPVEGIETKAEATLVYDGNTKQSTDPEVTIIKPDGSSNTMKLPDSALDDGELMSQFDTTIPPNWLGTRENEIIVRTADDSVVSATITTKGLEYQNKSLDYGS
ncbi:hypothetical protein RH831_10505, partial [Halodesulfurarchaeum sp. HSR-GB]|uniref:hypothetical protein n=1 Tax=Halodesulfurarchaeum sp. HSR-GB TaxID=3074077 RepID=UPI0028625231